MFAVAPTCKPVGRSLCLQVVAATTPRHKGALKMRKNRPKKVWLCFDPTPLRTRTLAAHALALFRSCARPIRTTARAPRTPLCRLHRP